jgi:hypothetical protein
MGDEEFNSKFEKKYNVLTTTNDFEMLEKKQEADLEHIPNIPSTNKDFVEKLEKKESNSVRIEDMPF